MARPAILRIDIITDARRAAAGLGQIAGAAGRTASSIGRVMGGAARAVVNVAANTVAVGVGAMTAFGAAVIKSGISYNVLQQKSRAAFTTILGSAKAADKMMSDIAAFAQTSPFPRQAFIEATQQMLSFGINSKKVIPYLSAIQDAVAAAGGGAQELSEISFVMSQISAAGKITGQDLIQFGQRGINAAELIGSTMGKTGAQIKAEITAGTLDANKALDALAKGMTSRYGGAAAQVKNTWAGATDRIKGAMRDVGSVIVAPFIDPKGGGYALTFANKIADALRKLEPAVAPFMKNVMAKLSPLLERASSAVGSLVDKLSGIGKGGGLGGLTGDLKDMAPMLATAGAALAAIGGANLSAALGPLGALLPRINPLAAAFAALAATMPEVRTALAAVFKAFKPLLPIVGNLAKQLGGVFTAAVKAVLPVVVNVARAVAGVLATAMKSLDPLLRQIAPLFGELARIVGATLTPVIKALEPILPVLTAALGQVLAAVRPMLPSLAQLGAIIGQTVAQALAAVAPLLPTLAKLITAVLNAVRPLLPVLLLAARILSVVLVTALRVVVPPINLLVRLVARLASVIGASFRAASSAVSAAGRAIGSAVSAIVSRVRSVLSAIGGVITGPFRSGFNSAKSIVSGAVSALGRAASGVVGAIGRGLSGVFRAVTAPFQKAWDWVQDHILAPIKSAFSTIATGVGKVKGAWNTVAKFINKVKISWKSKKVLGVTVLPGGSIDPFPHIPTFARGAYVRRATLAVVGEGRGSEIVTPDDVMRRIVRAELERNGGPSFVANITVNGALDPVSVARQIRGLLDAEQRRMRGVIRTGVA